METHKELYIISFGTSSKYRFYADENDRTKMEKSADIRKYLMERFPDGGDMKFIETPDVERISSADEAKYSSYPLLDASTLSGIEKHLATEHEVVRDTDEINSDAPFDSLNPDALG